MKNSNSKHRKKKRKSLSRGLPLFSEVGAETRVTEQEITFCYFNLNIIIGNNRIIREFSSDCKLNGIELKHKFAGKRDTSRIMNLAYQPAAALERYNNFTMISYGSTTLASAAVKLGKHSSTYLAAKYNCKNATIDIKVDSKSQLSASLSFSGKFLPSTKIIASLKLPHYSSSEVQMP
ncbi:hypothetical protein Patl1_35274 [Pistacia atlantica]|nr:hypothetical protein Patl1_35274 [Pistacia atlantica]